MAASWPVPLVGASEAGLRIAILERPGPLAAVRLTIGAGARHGSRAGSAHMLEHLLFRTRSGAQARRSLERLGGEIGATTTREQLSIDAVVLADDVERALEALARLCAAAPTAGDLDRERDVVQRELAHEEEERRRLWQLQAEALFGAAHPLARPILGTAESIEAMTVEDLEAIAERFTTDNAALAAAGPIAPDELAAACADILGDRRGVPGDAPQPPPAPARRRHEERRSRLIHLAVGWRFEGIDDPRLPALRLLESVLAFGSGSRLYARLRTRRRIAYRISTVLIPYREAGHLSVVTACDPHHARQAELAIVGEIEKLAGRGPTYSELAVARRQFEASLARAFETSRRLAGFSATQLLFDRVEPVDEMLAQIHACTPADVAAVARDLLQHPDGHAVASVGRTPRD
jgi:predicted Zn-dependent peptidase